MDAQTYLSYDGCCEAALDFYCKAIRAEKLFMMRYQEGPPELIPPGGEEKIFHATMRIGSTLISLSDDMKNERGRFGGFAILLHADSDADAELFFAQLAEGGDIQVPIQESMWASRYGIVRDKFGIYWKIQHGKPDAGAA